MTEEDTSNYRETEQSVHGLETFEQANALRELTERGLKKLGVDADYCLRVETRDDGLFDLVVLRRVN